MSRDEATLFRLAKSVTKQYNLRPDVSQESSKLLKDYESMVWKITDEMEKEHRRGVKNKKSEMDEEYESCKLKMLAEQKAEHDVDASTTLEQMEKNTTKTWKNEPKKCSKNTQTM